MSEESKFPMEDYRVIWREFYCAAIQSQWCGSEYASNRSALLNAAAQVADEALEIYIKRKNKLREYNLGAFK